MDLLILICCSVSFSLFFVSCSAYIDVQFLQVILVPFPLKVQMQEKQTPTGSQGRNGSGKKQVKMGVQLVK